MGPLVLKLVMVLLLAMGVGWHVLPLEVSPADESQVHSLELAPPPQTAALVGLVHAEPEALSQGHDQAVPSLATPPCGLRAPPV